MATEAAKPRFTIKKWSGVALWSWNIAVDNCAICRNHIMDLCIECQVGLRLPVQRASPPHAPPLNLVQAAGSEDATNNDDRCTVAWGACSHAFHLHCISKWLKTRHVCPLDNTQWDFATKEAT